MQQIIDAAASYYVITLIGACFLVSTVFRAITSIVSTMARERSRREIAAYVAEGSITPDHGERLIRANVNQQHASEVC